MTETMVKDAGLDALLDLWPDEVVGGAPSCLPTPVPQDDHDLPHDITAPARARHIISSFLRQWGVSADARSDALLIVSELVTNAVEHALPPLTMTVVLDRSPIVDGIRIAVTEGGLASTQGEWGASCTSDEHGRGQVIVVELSSACGPLHSSDRVTRWAHIGHR
ncbi:ATP-binding protein [Streptomyces sp. NPDC087908]|uniref:ATP-binding protein n=1 Tax=Streptomyces sp. NPDC087908 TaxID=3365820 RepID=UPI0038004D6E